MSFSEEEKSKALQLYDETGSISKVIQNWGIRADRIWTGTAEWDAFLP